MSFKRLCSFLEFKLNFCSTKQCLPALFICSDGLPGGSSRDEEIIHLIFLINFCSDTSATCEHIQIRSNEEGWMMHSCEPQKTLNDSETQLN